MALVCDACQRKSERWDDIQNLLAPGRARLRNLGQATLNGSIATALQTDVGRLRRNNEDAVESDPELGLLVLADGMGGYNGGEFASRLAVSTTLAVIRGHWPPLAAAVTDRERGWSAATLLLRRALDAAHQAIRQASRENSQYAGMGTTAVACLFHENRLSIAHAGDSRLYRLRDGRLEQLTRDHSLIEESVASGRYTRAEADREIGRHIITRALGADTEMEFDLLEQPFALGDIILLCSDGLSDMLDDETIRLTLIEFTGNLQLAAAALIGKANANGGRDNVSVALARVDAMSAPRRP